MNIYHGMVCPVCEVGTLESHPEELEFDYKGRKTVISGKTLFRCPECDESFLSPRDEREIEKYLTDARRTIDGLLTSHEIKAIREHFQMTQVEFARLLRVSDKTFARYENGQVAQGYAMDDLLRILREFPETIRVVSFSSSSNTKAPNIGKAREPASLS